MQEEFQHQGAKLAMLEQTAAEGSHGIAGVRRAGVEAQWRLKQVKAGTIAGSTPCPVSASHDLS